MNLRLSTSFLLAGKQAPVADDKSQTILTIQRFHTTFVTFSLAVALTCGLNISMRPEALFSPETSKATPSATAS